MLRFSAITIAIALLAAAPAAGQEVRPSLTSRAIWSDNVFGSSVREQDDFSFRLSPRIEATEPKGALTWSLQYEPSFEYFLDFSELRGWDHEATASVSWRVTPDTVVRLSDSFERFRSISRLNEVSTQSGIVSSEVGGLRRRFIRNSAALSLSHDFDRQNQTTVGYQYFVWDFSDRGRADVDIHSAWINHAYLLNADTQLAGRFSWRNREDKGSLSSQETDTYSFEASVVHKFDPTFTLSLSGGPALVDSTVPRVIPQPQLVQLVPVLSESGGLFPLEIQTCPSLPDGRQYLDFAVCQPIPFDVTGVPNPPAVIAFSGVFPESDDSELTFLGRFELKKEFATVDLSLEVSRREDQSSGNGSSSVENTGRFVARWRASRRWNVTGVVHYSVRERVGDFTRLVQTVAPGVGAPNVAVRTGIAAQQLDDSGEDSSLSLNLSTHYKWNRRLTLLAAANWYDRKDERFGTIARDTDRLTVWLGFRYRLNPLQF